MTDEAKALVERLRELAPLFVQGGIIPQRLNEAATLIETQAREIERLRGLLREAEVKLADVQGAYATKQYSANLLTRIRAALAGDSQD